MNPEVILFDLGDVVCHYVPERRLEKLGAACGVSPGDVESALYATGLIDAWDLGDATAGRIHEVVRTELGFTGGLRALQELWATAFEPDHDVLRLVKAVRPRRTALFSNNDALLLDALPRVMPQVAACFDAWIFSCDLGAKKPNPRAFQQALSALSASPGETLFIDDKSANAEAAENCGITALQFRGAAELEENLAPLFSL
ncbi:HAD family phosphatase [Streptomyces sp. NBC_00876]|uniref:HAD family hydrolase n=1 Tax=Streptomyces sp. NBC_00876 TaxID=2975853 RepID=UPI0038701EF5|nr:HAD family phosphatase [Streptomyces sp. NBC_00876]